MPLKIKATVANKIGFASQQNAVPILYDLVLVNEGDSPLEDLEVSLTAEPDFLEGRTWNVDRLDGEQVITDRDVRLSATYLDTLIEGVRGEVLIEVRRRDSEGDALAKERFELEVLGKSHWGGSGSMPELLPAFCLPNDTSIEQITGNAAELLRAHGKYSKIQGYEGSNPKWIWTIASAIWGSVCGLNIKYSLPPASFEEVGQKVRSPSLVLDAKLATCLDTSLLFAAALQQAGLNPLIILTEGHAFVGVWLHDRTFKMQVVHEAMEVRKLVELDEILVFETTYITKSTAPRFSEAICAAKEKLTDNEFRMAIDIGLARKKGIRPLNFSLTGNEVPTSEGEGAPAEHAGLEEAPDDLLPPPDLPPESVPSDGDGNRIEHWQRRLLDLSARNRLLNLPERAKHVPLSCPDPGALEDLLAAGKTIAISPLPDLEEGGRDAELYKEHNKEDLVAKYAEEALKGREVLSPRSKQKLEASLIDLFRRAKSDIAEGGANTLFLAIGFLNWRKNPEDEKYYRAPLILLPIKLKRRSALSGVKMSQHEDEPRFNLTLLEFLRQDYELEIPGLEGDLPTDDSGIDVDAIWNRVRIAVKDVPGFELNTECAIGTFSFSKYLMWKDLVDRSDELMVNPVVKHLIEGGEEGFENTGSTDGIPRAEDLDRVVDQSALFTPLPADSSQLAAVVASASGQNFVLDGPPGTGKSQTIANMIAHNLAMGRKVLFVAEKMAALEVVYRRLEEHGLGEFCLEAHSNKASKKDILEQLDRSWTVRAKDVHNDWAS